MLLELTTEDIGHPLKDQNVPAIYEELQSDCEEVQKTRDEKQRDVCVAEGIWHRRVLVGRLSGAEVGGFVVLFQKAAP